MRRASAHVVVIQSGRILLLRRGPTAPWAPGKWGLPGGYVEPGETPAQAAVRELAEEAGIDPPFRMTHAGGLPGRTPGYLFRVERPAAYPFSAYCRDGEHDRTAWVHPDEVYHYDLAPGVALSLAIVSMVGKRRGA